MNKKLFMFGIVVILVTGTIFAQERASPSFPENFTCEQLYEEGLNLFRQEQYQKAIDYFKEVTKRNFSFCDAHYQLGLCYIKLNNLKEAKENLGRVRIISQDEKLREKALTSLNQIGLYEKGKKALEAGKYQQAFEYFDDSAKGEQGIEDGYYQASLCCIKLLDVENSRKYLLLIENSISDKELKRKTSWLSKNLDTAIRDEKEKQSREKILGEGNRLLEDRKYADAISFFEKAIKERPNLYDLYYRLSESYCSIKEFNRARDMIKNASIEDNVKIEIEHKINQAEKANEERQRKIAAAFPGFAWGTPEGKIVPKGIDRKRHEWLKEEKRENGLRIWSSYLFNDNNQLVGGRITYRVVGFNKDSNSKLDVPDFAKSYIKKRDLWKKGRYIRRRSYDEVRPELTRDEEIKEYKLRNVAYISSKLFETKEKEIEDLYGDPTEKRKGLEEIPKNISNIHGGLAAPNSYIMNKWENDKTVIFLFHKMPVDEDVIRDGDWGRLHWHVQIFYYSKLFYVERLANNNMSEYYLPISK